MPDTVHAVNTRKHPVMHFKRDMIITIIIRMIKFMWPLSKRNKKITTQSKKFRSNQETIKHHSWILGNWKQMLFSTARLDYTVLIVLSIKIRSDVCTSDRPVWHTQQHQCSQHMFWPCCLRADTLVILCPHVYRWGQKTCIHHTNQGSC